MGIIYPDNIPRSHRVEQLFTNIGSIQSEVKDSIDRVQLANNHQLDSIDAILRTQGLSGVTDLKAKLDALLTPAQKAAYEESVKHIRGQSEVTDKILDASLVVGFISGGIGLAAAPVARIISTGALAAGADLFSRGFSAMVRGEEVGSAMMRAAFRTFRALRAGGEVSEIASKITRVVKVAATVLAVLGFVLDAVILIYQAVEGAKQKEELVKGIHELLARRFMAKKIEDQTFATEAYVSQVSAFLTTYNVMKSNGLPEAVIKQTMDALLKNVVDNLNGDLNKITDDKVWNQCADIDSQTQGVYKDDDVDLAWINSYIESQPPIEKEDEGRTQAGDMHHEIAKAT